MTRKTIFMVLAVSGTLVMPGSPLSAAGLNFCFGPTILRSVPNPDLTDGNIETDNGWLNAFTYRGGNGSPDADIILRGNTFTNGAGHQIIALGVSALNDETFESGDFIAITYKVPGQLSWGKIVIQPLHNDGTAGTVGGAGTTTKFSTVPASAMKSDPSGFWANDVTNPPWLSWGARVTADGNPCVQSGHGSACRWDVEISIDTTLGASAGVPASFEQFYVDVVEWISTGPADPNPINHQFSWPPGNILQDASDPSTTLTPAPSMWGAASVGTTSLCKGVYFGSSDISVGNLQADGNLKVGVASPITANLHNNGSTAATGVIAHFAHAPFGLCPNPWVFDESCYTDIGQTAAPSIGTSGVTPVSKTWTPVPGDVGGAANQHTCLRVRLESTAGGTTFVNQGDFKNMYVDHASTAASTPIINMKAAAPPIGGGPTRVRLVEQRGAQFAYGDGALSAVPIGALTSQGRIVYRGYRYTGKHLTVGGIASEIWEPVGAYGYTIQHVLAAQTQVAFETRHKGLFDRFTNPVTTVGGGTTTTTGTTLPGQGAGTVVPRELATNTNATGTTSGGSVATGTGGTATFAPAVYQAVNEDLAVLTDRPAATDFSADLQGAKVVSASGAPKVVEIELPAEGVATVPTSISFVGTDQPPPGCPGCATTSTATKVSSIGFMILGVLAIKRRRR